MERYFKKIEHKKPVDEAKICAKPHQTLEKANDGKVQVVTAEIYSENDQFKPRKANPNLPPKKKVLNKNDLNIIEVDLSSQTHNDELDDCETVFDPTSEVEVQLDSTKTLMGLEPTQHQKRKSLVLSDSEYESDATSAIRATVSIVKSSKKSKTNKKKYNQKFSTSWLEHSSYKSWLEKARQKDGGDDLGYCKICKCTITAHKTAIERHMSSSKHLKKTNEVCKNKSIKDMCNKKNSIYQQQKRAEIILAAYVAENNQPLSTMDSLVNVIKHACPDSLIAMGLKQHRTKASHVIKNSISKSFQEDIKKSLCVPGNFFSIIIDETTDVSSIKQCALVVIYYSLDNKVETRFLDMLELPKSTSSDLLAKLKEALEKRNIPITNMVGFSSDTTNVMFGEHMSVVSALKKECANTVFVKCSCHMIHLVASKACLKLPRSIEDLLRNIGSHFSRSYHRQKKFQEFQEFFSVEIHKMLVLGQTRWLSLKSCVDRVLEQYTPLKEYLRVTVFDDPSKTTEDMLATMNNKFTEVYLEFMSYTLGLFNDFNLMFQSESPLLHKLKPEVESLLKTIASNYLKMQVVRTSKILEIDHKNKDNFVSLNEVYLGLSADESYKRLEAEQSEKIKFMETCRDFYIESFTQIKARFCFKDDIFSIISILDPSTAHSFKIKSVQPVFTRFPVLHEYANLQNADKEWRTHALLDLQDLNIDPSLQADQYWNKVFSLKNAAGTPLFKDLKKVVQLLIVLPYSNAAVERVFSVLNNTKTHHRNKLKTDTVVALMTSKEGIEKCGGSSQFEPTKVMMKSDIWE